MTWQMLWIVSVMRFEGSIVVMIQPHDYSSSLL